MRVARGKVVGNTIVLEESGRKVTPPDGTAVTVYVDEAWDLDEASWKELDEARAAIDRGELVTDEALDSELDAAP